MKKSSKERMKQKIYSQNISLSRKQMTNNHPIGLKKNFSGNRSFREEFIQKKSLTILLNLKNEIKKSEKHDFYYFTFLCYPHLIRTTHTIYIVVLRFLNGIKH